MCESHPGFLLSGRKDRCTWWKLSKFSKIGMSIASVGEYCMQTAVFHLAFPIGNVADAKAFYVDGLGCELGRESHQAVILNLYGTQLVAHVTREPLVPQQGIYPRHFGLVFNAEADWQALHDRAAAKGLTFYQAAKRRFPDTPLDHQTFFLQDPFHNLLEFKYYHNPNAIFGEREQGQIGDRVERSA